MNETIVPTEEMKEAMRAFRGYELPKLVKIFELALNNPKIKSKRTRTFLEQMLSAANRSIDLRALRDTQDLDVMERDFF